MSCCICLSLPALKALSPLSPSPSKPPLCIASQHKPIFFSPTLVQKFSGIRVKADDFLDSRKSIMAAQVAAIFATLEHPALAVTGVNNEPELGRVVIDLGLAAVWYFLIMPPIIMNWLRIRWYKRNFVEMYFQFMFVFMFFPGLILWAPFLNFRKFPRDPSMKNPWETPKDPSKVKNAFLKYPFADPEDYA